MSHAGGQQVSQRITPTLMFVGDVCGKAEEAAAFYTSVLPDSSTGFVQRYGADADPDTEGTIQYESFRLAGQEFAAMDSAREHGFTFNEAISFIVNCDDQAELDRYWTALSAVPESEQCGWLKDRYGLSWQISPLALDEMLRHGNAEQVARVTAAFLPMKKLDLAELQRAYDGA